MIVHYLKIRSNVNDKHPHHAAPGFLDHMNTMRFYLLDYPEDEHLNKYKLRKIIKPYIQIQKIKN